MSVFSVIGSVFGTAFKLGKIVLPILKAFRLASPEIDSALDKVDDVIAKGAEEADDFFDRNMETIDGLQEFSQDAVVAFGDLDALCARIKAAALDDEVTPAEAKAIGLDLAEVKESIFAMMTTASDLEEKVEVMA